MKDFLGMIGAFILDLKWWILGGIVGGLMAGAAINAHASVFDLEQCADEARTMREFTAQRDYGVETEEQMIQAIDARAKNEPKWDAEDLKWFHYQIHRIWTDRELTPERMARSVKHACMLEYYHSISPIINLRDRGDLQQSEAVPQKMETDPYEPTNKLVGQDHDSLILIQQGQFGCPDGMQRALMLIASKSIVIGGCSQRTPDGGAHIQWETGDTFDLPKSIFDNQDALHPPKNPGHTDGPAKEQHWTPGNYGLHNIGD